MGKGYDSTHTRYIFMSKLNYIVERDDENHFKI